jgi:uncharacterized Zn-binding protein involved in type VI secretion
LAKSPRHDDHGGGELDGMHWGGIANMTKPFIVLGDKTDHGGTVVSASGTMTTGGKGIACVGDHVICPRPGHSQVTIVSGDPNVIIDGRAAARHGDKGSCGCTLLSTQGLTGNA